MTVACASCGSIPGRETTTTSTKPRPSSLPGKLLFLNCPNLVKHLSFSEIQAELANLPILPNFVKIKNPLNVLKFKFSKFISFLNTLTIN